MIEHLFYTETGDETVGAEFDPSDLSGMVVWLDCRDVSGSVSSWPDRSANNYDAKQSVAARRPVASSETSPNGTVLVSFDGSATAGQEDFLDGIIPLGDYPSVANGWTFVFAGRFNTCKKPAASNSSAIFDGNTANAPRLLYEDGDFGHKYAFDDSLGQQVYSAFSSGNQVLTYVWSAGSGGPTYTGDVECFRSGVSLGTKSYSIDTSGVTNYRLGDKVPSGQPCFMDLACFFWFRRALTPDELGDLWAWIEGQFGY